MMPEISLNILDIAENSMRAGSKLTVIDIKTDTKDNTLTVVIDDDGCGMSKEQLEKVTDPFFTSRKTRDVGLGVPFYKQAAELTGGSFEITSAPGVGTKVTAVFKTDSIDCMPLGDIDSTMFTLITCHADVDILYKYSVDGAGFELDTREMKEILGGIPLDAPEVSGFIKDFLKENREAVSEGNDE